MSRIMHAAKSVTLRGDSCDSCRHLHCLQLFLQHRKQSPKLCHLTELRAQHNTAVGPNFKKTLLVSSLFYRAFSPCVVVQLFIGGHSIILYQIVAESKCVFLLETATMHLTHERFAVQINASTLKQTLVSSLSGANFRQSEALWCQ